MTSVACAVLLFVLIVPLQNAAFVGSSQITRCLSPEGDPVLLVPVGSDNVMNANDTAICALWFVQTQFSPIRYTPRVLGATGTR